MAMMTRRRFFQTLIASLWLGFLLMIISTVLVLRWYNTNLQPVDRQQTIKKRFEIAPRTSVDEIARNLKEQGLIKNVDAFKWHLRINGKAADLQAGVYEVSPSDYASEIAEIISSGVLASLKVTIYPGQRLYQIEVSLIEQGFAPLDVQRALQLERYAEHPVVLNYIPPDGTLEGYIAPETFVVQQFNANAIEDIIRQSLDIFLDHLTPDIQNNLVRNAGGVHRGVILASIIEKEVTPEDRAKVAQVFIKRLKEGMKLESDVTYQYAAAIGDGEASVSNPSLYNTYQHAGLIPGPVSSVSKSSLQAVAFPSETDYLFFVTGDDGAIYFNATYAEHLEDVRNHCSGCLSS